MGPDTEATPATDTATTTTDPATVTTDATAEVAPEANTSTETTATVPAQATAPAAEETPAPAEAPAADSTETKDEPLGEAGVKALAAEREARKEASKALAALQAEFDTYKATAEKGAVDPAIVTERDALKAKVAEFEAETHKRAAADAFTAAATAAGAPNPALVVRLADISKFDGTPESAAAALEAVKAEFPDQFKAPTKPGLGTQDGATGKTKAAYFTREQVAKMNETEYAANRQHVLESMKTW